jgi:septal ring factor EnvC (AmiA/AmiB activator)
LSVLCCVVLCCVVWCDLCSNQSCRWLQVGQTAADIVGLENEITQLTQRKEALKQQLEAVIQDLDRVTVSFQIFVFYAQNLLNDAMIIAETSSRHGQG